MKIASISVSFNDDMQLSLFREHYDEYKNLLDLHIIVDNGSSTLYINKLEEVFPNSVLIKRNANGGTTAAYNDGIKYALMKGMDAILLIAQDVKLPVDSLREMIDTLTTRADVGIVGPLLLKADGQTVEEFGGVIDYKSLEITKLYRNYLLDHSIPDEQYVGFISGGINLTRREVFEGIGLQDERLFMYGDETDFNMRAKKAGWKLLVKSSIVAIHEHQGKASSFKPMCEYLLARNELWLARKHLDKKTYIFLAIQKLIDFPRHLGAHLKRRQFGLAIAYTKGVFHGLIRNRNEQVY